MKFSERWLKTLVDTPLAGRELAQALTMAGLEVEALEPVAPAFDRVVVAHVKTVVPHPNADRLRLCDVDNGTETLRIVCGAPNVAAGQKVPLAMLGAELPGITIKKAAIRGIESSGMLCSAKELGLSEEAGGIMVLPDEAPIGASLRDYLELDDNTFTLKLTPNRGDCLSVLGVAREVAAITNAQLRLPAIQAVAATLSDELKVTLSAPEACPRYCGRLLRGVNAKAATPAWLRRALERSGLRCVSALVDVTNFVMLELGQPLHAFDLGKIEGNINVRFARQGEPLKLLNGQDVVMDADLLVIADECKALGLGGVMGGDNTAVSDETKDVFLESAFFSPQVIAGRARRLNLTSDAAYRFERGVDFDRARRAIERATALMLEICGGQAGPVVDTQTKLPARGAVRVRGERVRRVLGIALSDAEIARLFDRLGFVHRHSDTEFAVTPPSFRFDLSLEEDFIEEIARIHGYDQIPAAQPKVGAKLPRLAEATRSTNSIRAGLVERGYQEVITYSFVDAQWERDFAGNEAPAQLQNPIASQMGVMRSTLLGGLVTTLQVNLNRKQERVRIFELGRCFTSQDGAVPSADQQPLRFGGLCFGLNQPEQWGADKRAVDFFDVKADVEALLAGLGPRWERAQHVALHPGRAAAVHLGEHRIGWLGELHPALAQRYELASAPIVFELDLAPLLQQRLPRFSEPSKFPLVRRDISLLVDEQVPVQALLDTARSSAPALVSEIEVFDLYRGSGIDKGKKSVAFRVVMQDTSKTLADEEIESVRQQIISALSLKHHIQLRS